MNAIKSEILLVRQEEEIQPQINTALHGFFKPARVPAQSVTALAASASMSLMARPFRHLRKMTSLKSRKNLCKSA
jgi:hypothetical protein